MRLPDTYTAVNETGCCPVPNVADWDKAILEFSHEPFVRMCTRSVLFMPLNMGRVMTALNEVAQRADVLMPPERGMILSRDVSPWRAEHLYAVSEPVPGADNVELSGTFLSRVFEGPYREAGRWHRALLDYASAQGRAPQDVYFFYTTCPKCAKHYGVNYVVGLVSVAPITHPVPSP